MKPSLTDIARCHDTDKWESVNYLANYEHHISHLREQAIRLLEIGVLKGGSLLMWADYFKAGEIVGIDINPCPLAQLPPTVSFHQGSQSDSAFLHRVSRTHAPTGFDIIIDDASHFGSLSRESFRVLFDAHLKPGGIYVIEDWGTGYWGSWPDGSTYVPAQPAESGPSGPSQPSLLLRLMKRMGLANPGKASPPLDPNFAHHNFGMVGFVKELIDEVGWADVTHAKFSGSRLAPRHSTIRSMTVSHGQVFIVKA